jgi:hypothetical protein
VGFAGYCDDGCEPARSPLPDLLKAAGAALVAIAVALAVALALRWIERQRSPQQHHWVTLLIPVVLAWLVVGVASLPADALLRNPKPQGRELRVAHERCVSSSNGLPCRSVSNLHGAADGDEVLLVWKSATAGSAGPRSTAPPGLLRPACASPSSSCPRPALG